MNNTEAFALLTDLIAAIRRDPFPIGIVKGSAVTVMAHVIGDKRLRELGIEIRYDINSDCYGFYMSDDGDGVTVTENETRPQRPDSTAQQEAAEIRAQEVIRELDQGLISRRGAISIKHAAKRAISGHDLRRGIGNLS